ncbi:prepilin peptidase [Pectinatus frisingensis]|uniref:prepilin peptidase n=1 Tax=Pectinatus frisingensis TaxID=865 RepID=UPI003D807B64
MYFLIIAQIPLFFWLSYLMAFLSSIWIDTLYRKNCAILSFPDRQFERAKFRQILLTIAFTTLFCYLSQMTSIVIFTLRFIVAAFLLLIICTDFEQQVIFDKMLLYFACFSLLPIFFQLSNAIDCVIAAFGGGLCFFLLSVLTHGGIGGGDIKLIFTLGLWLGIINLILVILIGFLLGGIAAIFLCLARQKNCKAYFAYGPYFALPALLFYIL